MLEKGTQVKVSYRDQLKEQHQLFCLQRDQTQANLQQIVGAIYACELMLSKGEDETDVPGDMSDVKVDEPEAEEA